MSLRSICTATLFASILWAQAAHGQRAPQASTTPSTSAFQLDRPVGLQANVKPASQLPVMSAPLPDRATIALEDEAIEARGEAPRFAIPNDTYITPKTHGAWEQVGQDEILWRLRINSPGALSMNLGFGRYHMPEGGTLFLYAADGKYILRPFTAEDNETHGELWTPVVLSDDIVVEVLLPIAAIDSLDLVLTSINPGYRGFGEKEADSDLRVGSCNVDIVCPEGDPWRAEIPAVGVISTGGSRFCSGFMVNNTAQDLTPFFMTANHCGVNSGNAASLVVYWNYYNSTCRPVGSAQSGQPGNGSLATNQTGSFFRASFSTSDFTLVELDDDPNPAWEISFAGWDKTDHNGTSAVGIHHPDVLEKRITFENQATATASYLGTTSPGDGTHVRIIDWDLGTTEPGSSGSPVFDQNHHVMGQLHGGGAACGNNDSDYYGRFFISWTGGGSNSTRLSNWLDAGNTGATSVDTISGAGMSVVPGTGKLHIGLEGGPFNDPTTVYTVTNYGSTPINYSVELTQSFGILLNGDRDPITGSLAAGGGSTTVTVTLGEDIYVLSRGLYVEDIVFTDTTNNKSQTRTHTVEVGQTLFGVTPATGLAGGGPIGGPFSATQVYTITSQRPTPVTVRVSPSTPWISVDGGNAPVDVLLSTNGASANVTVGYYGPNANGLAAGIYNGAVNFTNQVDAGSGDTTRPVSLDVGRYNYNSADVPKPINDNTTINSVLNVSDFYCIGDVNVDVNITHTYIGDLVVELKSPQGTTVRLHNRTGGSADNIVATYDDGVRTPDGPGTLANFIGQSPSGQWTLTVSDQAGQDTGTLNSWALHIATAGSNCPPVAQPASATVPVCNFASIDLVGLSELGPNMDYVIDTLPTKGSLYDPAVGTISSVPYTLVGQDNGVVYRPSPFQTGADSFMFHVYDGAASNQAMVSLTIDAGARTQQYAWNFDTNPGWTTDPGWQFGVPTGGGSPTKDPTSGRTGSNVYGYNLSGNYEPNLPARYLVTTAIDCSQLQSTQLRFWRWLGVESFDDAKVEVSNNGTTWTTIFDNPSGAGFSIGDTVWIEAQYSIAAVADGQPTVYVRWTMGPTDATGNYPGWNIDDVSIWAMRPGYGLSYDALGTCLAGPDVDPAASCGCADRDGDLDVDLKDFAIFQQGG